jgi:hypothetical protein
VPKLVIKEECCFVALEVLMVLSDCTNFYYPRKVNSARFCCKTCDALRCSTSMNNSCFTFFGRNHPKT